jgi:predicted RNase H-like nuclease
MRLLGLDGCRGGWVVAEGDESLSTVRFSVACDIGVLLDAADPASTRVAIDMPIGLPHDGPRACDLAARALLRAPRASSVFPAPTRAALPALDYATACLLNLEACGRRLSRQAFAIFPKLRAVDCAMTPERQRWVREAHPEVTFAALAGAGRGLAAAKRLPAGRAERLALLAMHLPALTEARIDAERANLGGPLVVGRDDLVDAAVLLVTAWRIASQQARVFPAGLVSTDQRGLRMEIVA